MWINRSMQVNKDEILFAQSHKAIVGMLISLFLFGGCTTDKDVMPKFYQKTADKKAPDFTQKDIHTKDGHVIKFEGTYVRSYKNGKKDGITALYQYGVLYAEKSYKNDVLHGLSGNYHSSLSEVYYVDGKKHGTEKVWCDGNRKKLKSRMQYNHGLLEGKSEKWNCHGRHYLVQYIEYKNGKKDGIYKMYDNYNFKNGKLVGVETYKNGKKNGISKQYHSNGKLCCLDTYKNGIMEGESKFWDHTGKLGKDLIYKNGRAFDKNGNFISAVKEKQ